MQLTVKEVKSLITHGLANIKSFDMEEDRMFIRCKDGHIYWCWMDSYLRQTAVFYLEV